MIIRATEEKNLPDLAEIYNSANTLFPEQERGTASPELFLPQLETDENFIALADDGQPAAFVSWRRSGRYFELTSLYVRREAQRGGAGSGLLRFFEEQARGGETAFVKVLKNAPWSESFYRKNGYRPPGEREMEIAGSLDLAEKRWSRLLCKQLSGRQSSL